MSDSNIAVTEMGFPERVVQILQEHNIIDRERLCCVMLGQLKEWGLTPEETGVVVNAIKGT